MFEITYHGGNAIKINTKQKALYIDANVVPYGLKKLAMRASDVQIVTEPRFSVDDATLDVPVFNMPGEYEIGPFSIRGIAAQRHIDAENSLQTTIYRVEVGGIAIAVLGNIAPKLNESQLESLGVVDILLIPVGGTGYTLDAKDAAAIVKQVDPKLVIPTHYQDGGLEYEVPQESVEAFVSEVGSVHQSADKYKIKSVNDLPGAREILVIRRT